MKRILCVLSSTALMFVTLGGCQSQEDTIQDFSDGLSASRCSFLYFFGNGAFLRTGFGPFL